MSRSVHASESDAQDCIDLPNRTVRALTEYLTVTPDTGRARDVPGMVLVTSQSGSEYLVDVRDGRCECGDAQHRDPGGGCKHVRRARFATGGEAIPAAASQLDVDPDLGEHTAADLRFATADGGVVAAGGDADEPEGDEECACGDLPEGVPCADCYIAGEAEFEEGR